MLEAFWFLTVSFKRSRITDERQRGEVMLVQVHMPREGEKRGEDTFRYLVEQTVACLHNLVCGVFEV